MKRIKCCEANIVTAVCAELTYREKLGELFYIRNNSGAAKIGNRYFKFGKKGSSDILLFLPRGKTIFLEVKTASGRISNSQQEFRDKIKKLGYEYIIIRHPSDLNLILNTGNPGT